VGQRGKEKGVGGVCSAMYVRHPHGDHGLVVPLRQTGPGRRCSSQSVERGSGEGSRVGCEEKGEAGQLL
jgi:hypothetical protein